MKFLSGMELSIFLQAVRVDHAHAKPAFDSMVTAAIEPYLQMVDFPSPVKEPEIVNPVSGIVSGNDLA